MIPEPYKPGFFPPSPPFQSLVLMPSETLSDKKAMVMPLALISSVFHDIISFNHNPEWLSKRIRRSNFSLFFDCRYFPPFSRKSPDFFHSLSIPFSPQVLPEAHTLQNILREASSAAEVGNRLKAIGFTHLLYDEAYLFGEPSPLSAEEKQLFLAFQNSHLRNVRQAGIEFQRKLSCKEQKPFSEKDFPKSTT
ncbi:MAG: hypothetical protein AABZ40_02655 [Thermodesulfobacteriota bacterium]